MTDEILTPARLRAALAYDEATGEFRWREKVSRKVRVGAIAGGHHTRGYLHIGLDGRLYLAHRLAWVYSHGVWPDADIDHINGDRKDNRLANLRLATRSENLQNIRTATSRNLASGLLGAYRSGAGRWTSRIGKGGASQYLGCFATAAEAHAAYIAAKCAIHPFNTL